MKTGKGKRYQPSIKAGDRVTYKGQPATVLYDASGKKDWKRPYHLDCGKYIISASARDFY